MPSKVCSRCGKQKPIIEFYEHPEAKDRHQPYCKECAEALRREGYKPELRYRANAGREGEKLAIAQLKKNGIYAAPGKASEYR